MVHPALVRNKAQLTYNAVGNWLEETAAAPPKVAASSELQGQLKLQNDVAQALKKQRFLHGALNIDTNEVHPVLLNEQVVDIAKQERNLATELIEDFMIAANGVVARLLEKVSSLRRIVKTPKPGIGLFSWRRHEVRPCRHNLIPRRSTIFCSSAKRVIRTTLWTYRRLSSN